MGESRAVTPDQYMHGHHESVLRSHRWRTADNSAAYLLEHLRPDTRLLDVGCGPGTISIDLARRLSDGSVVGVDAAVSVVEAAQAEAQAAGVGNVEFSVADAYALEFDDATFDVVHAHQVLQHLTDPVAALGEMRRVVRDDGVVAARDSDYDAMTWFPASPRLDRWRQIYDRLARGNGTEPSAGRHLLAWARSAAFSSVQPSASVWCFATPEDRAWWGGLWADRVVASTFAEQATARDLATAAELEDLAAGWREWAADDDAWFVVVHGEVLCRK